MFLSRFKRNDVAARGVNNVCLLGVVLMLHLATHGSAQAQRASGLQPNLVTVESDHSVVFVNGEFIDSPYEIQYEDDCVLVNGHRLQLPKADLIHETDRENGNRRFGRGAGPEVGRGGGRRGQRSEIGSGRTAGSAAARFARELYNEVQNTQILVAFDGCPIRVLPINDQGLANLLAAGEMPSTEFEVAKAVAGFNLGLSGDEFDVWVNWLAGYEVSSELQNQVQLTIQNAAAFEAEFRLGLAQNTRLEQYAYPLTVLGMLLGVVALGYMLQWAGNGLNQFESTIESERYVVIALCMMAGMATIDFIWTVLAGQAGQMREVNPLAARFIESPTELAIFKILATGIGFGILYFWRQRQQIRQATWWMCLVSVLLTFRWVMFDSMRV